MPIYKMPGNKDGKQKYRVRINYTDRNGVAHQLDRVAYGSSSRMVSKYFWASVKVCSSPLA